MLLIKESKKHDWECCEHDVEDLEDPLLVEYLSRESTVEPKPELGHYEQHIFIESIRYQVRISTVRLSSMHKKKIFEEFKLPDCIIRCTNGLLTFNSRNTDPNMSCSNHIDIIGTISYR